MGARIVRYHRNDEALREALATYSVEGTKVTVPMLGPSVIESQRNMGMTQGSAPSPYYIVKALEPVPFEDWLRRKFNYGESQKKLTLDEWKKRRGTVRFGEHQGLNLPNYLLERLEKGETLSPADVEFDDLVNRGCMDQDQRVTCYTYWPNQITIDPSQLKKGALVEYVYDGVTYPGSVAGFSEGGTIVFLELFTPISYLESPDSIASEAIKPSFHSPYTYVLGYGVYEALERASEESGRELIPEGKWDVDDPKKRRLYTTKSFLPLEVVKEVCQAYEPEERNYCWWQSLILYVVPIKLGSLAYKGTWQPLPEKTVPTEAVISYEDEDEG